MRSGVESQVVIVGTGGHAVSVADAALSSGHSVLGFYSPDGRVTRTLPAETLTTLDSIDFGSVFLVHGIGTNHQREDAWNSISQRYTDAQWALVVHSTAWVSPQSVIEEGAVLLAHTSVGPGCVVEYGALLNTGSSLDHDSTLGRFGSLGPGARTGGGVHIGERTMVGMQASVLQKVTIGSDSVIGAHSLVNKHVEDNAVTWGTPAKIVRSRSREEPYF